MGSWIDQVWGWFNGVEPECAPKKAELPVGFVAPLVRDELLSDEPIAHRLTTLKRSGIGLPYELWDEFVVDTIVALSQYTQELPASENHHHAYQCGLLLHSLDVAIYALRIRRNYALPPLCAPEDRTFREIVWVYGVFVAALLHDVGKVFDFEIQLLDGNEHQKWDYTTPITQPYRFRYLKERHYESHKTLAHSLLSRVLSQNPMRALTHDRQLWNALSDFLTGQPREDNVLAEIVQQADAASVAQDLGAEGEAISIAAENAKQPSASLGSQLRLTLKHLLGSGKIPMNQKDGEGFIDGDMVYLVCQPVADLLRRELMERGLTHVPSDDTQLFNELQHYALIECSESGQAVVRVEVYLSDSDWRQAFTCILVNWKTLLPDADNLHSLNGSVTQLADEPNDKPVEPLHQEDASTHTSPPKEQVSEPVNESGLNEDLLLAAMGMASNITASEPEEKSDEAIVDANQPAAQDSPLSQNLILSEMSQGDLTTAFVGWVECAIVTGKHKANQEGALFHRIGDYLALSSPNAFKAFIQTRCINTADSDFPAIQAALNSVAVVSSSSGITLHQIIAKGASKPMNMMLLPLSDKLRAKLSSNPMLEWNDE
ncbi:MobH family relaxase [Vibrio lentus]